MPTCICYDLVSLYTVNNSNLAVVEVFTDAMTEDAHVTKRCCGQIGGGGIWGPTKGKSEGLL